MDDDHQPGSPPRPLMMADGDHTTYNNTNHDDDDHDTSTTDLLAAADLTSSSEPPSGHDDDSDSVTVSRYASRPMHISTTDIDSPLASGVSVTNGRGSGGTAATLLATSGLGLGSSTGGSALSGLTTGMGSMSDYRTAAMGSTSTQASSGLSALAGRSTGQAAPTIMLPLAAKILSDRKLARQTFWINVNAILGIVLMMAAMQLCWDGRECSATQNVHIVTAVSATCSALTIILIWQILDQKRFELERRYETWKIASHNRRAKHPKHDHGHGIHEHMSTVAANAVQAKRDAQRAAAAAAMWTPRHVHLNKHISAEHAAVVLNEHAKAAPERLPLWAILNLNCRYHIHWKTWIQVLICIIHPIPFAERFIPGFTIELALLMWLRLHLLVRLLRDNSSIWVHRHTLTQSSNGSTLAFDWWLTFKSVCYRHPLAFVVGITVIQALLFGHCIYILERETQPEDFTFSLCVWLSSQALVTGFAGDNFSLHFPKNAYAELAAVLATICGFFWIYLFLVMGSERLFPSRVEKQALFYLDRRSAVIEESHAAARLIQLVWRQRRLERAIDIQPSLYMKYGGEKIERRFIQKFAHCRKEFVSAVQQRAEIDDFMDTGVDPTIQELLHTIIDGAAAFKRLQKELTQLYDEYGYIPLPSQSTHHRRISRTRTRPRMHGIRAATSLI